MRAAGGERICRRITRQYARTFYFASSCLPRATRRHAYAVYGFCRWADNGVDDAADRAEATGQLDAARRALGRAYADLGVPPGLAEFRRTVLTRAIPKPLFDALLDGMEMDLDVTRYADFPALHVYCYRVAGVVGRMMSHVFGYRDPRCLPRAEALGTAMQLTNILRDVAEDWTRGRLYLPLDQLARFGVTETQIDSGRCDDALRALIASEIARARAYYVESEPGIPDLDGESSRLTVRVMGRLYAGILDVLERRGGDVFAGRASVPRSVKLATLARCLAESATASWRGGRV